MTLFAWPLHHCVCRTRTGLSLRQYCAANVALPLAMNALPGRAPCTAPQDVAASKVAILQANPDPTVKLMEMADLYQKGLVNAEELAGLKAKTLEALKA